MNIVFNKKVDSILVALGGEWIYKAAENYRDTSTYSKSRESWNISYSTTNVPGFVFSGCVVVTRAAKGIVRVFNKGDKDTYIDLDLEEFLEDPLSWIEEFL